MNKIKKARLAALSAGLGLAGSAAMAEVPAAVTASLGSLTTDALQIAGVILAAIVAVYAFKFMRKGIN